MRIPEMPRLWHSHQVGRHIHQAIVCTPELDGVGETLPSIPALRMTGSFTGVNGGEIMDHEGGSTA